MRRLLKTCSMILVLSLMGGCHHGKSGADKAHPLLELRADANHDGVIDLKGDSDVKSPGDKAHPLLELRADANHDGAVDLKGDSYNDKNVPAIFLANIDDDQQACEATKSEKTIDLCNDAADEIINGEKDLLDMARIFLLANKQVTDDVTAFFTIEPAERVRLFWLDGSAEGKVIDSDFVVSAEMIKNGMELALEGKDIVRDSSWDGTVKISISYSDTPDKISDYVMLKEAPVILGHHLNKPIGFYTSDIDEDNQMADDLEKIASQLDIPGGLVRLSPVYDDIWAQDMFEPATMSMPAADGKAHVIHVYIRTAAFYDAESAPRRGSRIVFNYFRGPDAAGVQAYKKDRTMDELYMDSLNSCGNIETLPPYSYKGQDYPLGRIFVGSTPEYYPDEVFIEMLESQNAQPLITLDTSWLMVGHVDEIFSVTKMANERGWGLLVNDARLAKTLLEELVAQGYGKTKMFEGKEWVIEGLRDYYYKDAAISINDLLDDEDVMTASQEAAVNVDSMVDQLKEEAGLTDQDFIPVPFLHYEEDGYSMAYMVGTVNGISLGDGNFVAPKPHGPIIDGVDFFQKQLEETLAKINVKTYWAEDWDLYHINIGEIHCGSNVAREAGTAERWWEKSL